MRWLLPLALAASINACAGVLHIGSGVVGVSLVNFEQLVADAAESAVRILVRESPADIASRGAPNTVKFDLPKFKRWGLEESLLSPHRQVLFQQLSLFIFETLLIAGFFVNRGRQKHAEKESTRLASLAAREHARLEEVVSNVPGIVWEVKLGPGDDPRVEFVSGYVEKMLGYSVDELSVPFSLLSIIPKDDWERVAKDAEEKFANGNVSVIECQCKAKDGRLFWTESHLTRVSDETGRLTGVRGVTLDITYRRQAVDDLRESEERFRTMADTAPVMIWISDTDNLCTYVNRRWLEFTGRSLEAELGKGWTVGIHPDDIERCLESHTQPPGGGGPFTIEYRLRRYDGKFRWIYDSGTSRHSPTGKFLGYIGSRIDITESKTLEQALANLSGQLILAREEESARVARELHDDLNQRMALISVQLDHLSQNPSTADSLRTQLKNVMSQVAEASREIHRMSYDLHPSKLVHLGLVAALYSLREELHQRHSLEVRFTNKDVPFDLSQDISLCLYRIAQECLSNVIRHSGVREAKVELLGTGKEIQLRVSDAGRGFDAESLKTSDGLGFISMRERLRLVGGKISLESRPLQGTTIEAIVPLTRAASKKQAPSTGDKSAAESRVTAPHQGELLESTGVSRAQQLEEREQGP